MQTQYKHEPSNKSQRLIHRLSADPCLNTPPQGAVTDHSVAEGGSILQWLLFNRHGEHLAGPMANCAPPPQRTIRQMRNLRHPHTLPDTFPQRPNENISQKNRRPGTHSSTEGSTWMKYSLTRVLTNRFC